MQAQHILVADDEPGLRRSLMLVLSGAGYDVTLVADGQQALDKLLELKDSDKPVDLLVTDIQMPRLTGLELIDKLAGEPWAPPVLVITGYGDKETVVELLRKGCKEFIDKPFGPDEAVRRIRDLLEREVDHKRSQEHINRRMAQEQSRLFVKIEDYRRRFEELSREFDAAQATHDDHMRLDPAEARLPVVLRSQTLSRLGGDLALYCTTERGCDILVADVAGHDAGASFHSVMVKAFFDQNCRTGAHPETFFRMLNSQLKESSEDERMVTASFLRIDLEDMVGETLCAGHPLLMRMSRSDDEPEAVQSEGPPLGLFDDPVYAANAFPIHSGDRLMLHTDGVAEASFLDTETGVRVKLSTEGLHDLMAAHRDHGLEDLVDSVWKDVLRFCGGKPKDDMLLLGLEIP
ncbi:MAG: PP2C family protein-serine/threonine phosphatase [Desulfovibrionaceae bacterium]